MFLPLFYRVLRGGVSVVSLAYFVSLFWWGFDWVE